MSEKIRITPTQRVAISAVLAELERVGNIASLFSEVAKIDPKLAKALGAFLACGISALERMEELGLVEIVDVDESTMH